MKLPIGMVYAAIALAPAAVPPSAVAQRTQHLAHDVSFAEPFGYVGGIRVLSSGRILVADPLGQVLVSIDMGDNWADTLGRVGGGPQEYRQPDAVFPLPGDSTLLTDLGNGRLTVIAPDGTFGETRPIPQEGASGRLTILLPRFVDSLGRIYYEPEMFTASGPADSAAVLRFDRATGKVDSIGAVMLSPVNRTQMGGRVMLSRGPLRLRDDWAVGPDGSVAIVHAEDFSVEWIFADGRTVRGPSIEYGRVSVGREEKEAWVVSQAVEAVNVRAMMSASGERSMQFSRGGGGGSSRGVEAYEWPDEMPPFRLRRSRVSPDGELWVERYGSANAPPVIDMFDRRGIKVGEITLPPGRRVAAFANGYVFLVHTDEVGLQWVEQYRIVGTE